MENFVEETMTETARRAAQRQLDAYNAHDVDAFVACYAEDVVIRDLRSGEVTGEGRDQMRTSYGAMFERFPEVHAAVTTRTVVGNFVFDHEFVTGRGDPLLVMAIYDVGDDGLISGVWFAR